MRLKALVKDETSLYPIISAIVLIERLGFEIKEMSRDLHNSDLAAKEFTTEYEEKFHGLGKNINYVKI